MNALGDGRQIELLLVEDNPGDARLAEETLKESKLLNRLHHVADGEQAMAFLRRQPPYEDAPRPDLIVLDLNLPKRDGRQVLQDIKDDQSLRSIPIVVLTISEAEEDILRSYDLHANCYITKPLDLEQFSRIVKSVEGFWFSVVTLPPQS